MQRTWILPCLLLAACGSDTARTRVAFEVEVGALEAPAPFTNELGWQVELSAAELHLQGLYFFEGEPLFARVDRRPWSERLFGLVLGTAYAHPGHYVEGEALADLLTPITVDLLADPVIFGTAQGVSGAYNSARVVLAPDTALEGHSLKLAGTAQKDGVTVPFFAHLDLDAAIEGVAFGTDIEASNGKVRFQIDTQEWVRRVDFSSLGSPSEPVELTAETAQPYNALTRGVENTAAFHFTWIAL